MAEPIASTYPRSIDLPPVPAEPPKTDEKKVGKTALVDGDAYTSATPTGVAASFFKTKLACDAAPDPKTLTDGELRTYAKQLVAKGLNVPGNEAKLTAVVGEIKARGERSWNDTMAKAKLDTSNLTNGELMKLSFGFEVAKASGQKLTAADAKAQQTIDAELAKRMTASERTELVAARKEFEKAYAGYVAHCPVAGANAIVGTVFHSPVTTLVDATLAGDSIDEFLQNPSLSGALSAYLDTFAVFAPVTAVWAVPVACAVHADELKEKAEAYEAAKKQYAGK